MVLAGDIWHPPAQMEAFLLAGALCRPRQYCAFVLASDISARQHCAPTTMLAGDNCMCQQSIFHVSAQIVFGLVLGAFSLMGFLQDSDLKFSSTFLSKAVRPARAGNLDEVPFDYHVIQRTHVFDQKSVNNDIFCRHIIGSQR
jgi:hypothetical protein